MIPPGLAALARRAGREPASVEALPGDVGRRRYFRLLLDGGRSVLGVVYPAEESDSRRRWVAARSLLAEKLRVPELVADDEAGNHLVEDFGRADLAARFLGKPAERGEWLGRATAALGVLAAISDPRINAPFDAAFFRRELDLAREAVFDMYLETPLSPADRQAHDSWADSLAREITAHPQVLCHRDYHGNNLFPLEGTVGWIDFQDMRVGPDSYDLASLLWERTTLDWMTDGTAEETIARFASARRIEPRGFRRRFDRVLLQRAWKVCGTFARAVARGRGEAYRRYLPGEIALVGRLLQNSGPDREFLRVFETRLAA